MADSGGRVVALCGGIGGAKLALGLYLTLGSGRLTLIINTGDDFEHLGLHVSPDIDTIAYTLSGLSNTDVGWGRANESWAFMAALEQVGGETWFKLGDSDLATHVERTRRLRAGESLTKITADFAARLAIGANLLPMSDDPVRTIVHTADGPLPFQHYFVKLKCAPVVAGVSFAGSQAARPNPLVLAALAAPNLRAVVLCPSNPYLSIDPILAVPGIRAALQGCRAPIIAVSPIVGGRAVKGPTAKIMAELGVLPSAAAVARHYDGLIDGLVIDEADADLVAAMDRPVEIARTVMTTVDDRKNLASAVMAFAARIEPHRTRLSPIRGESAHG